MACDELERVLHAFSERYNNNEKLQKMLRKWSVDLLVWCKDTDNGFLINVNNGRVVSIMRTEDSTTGRVKVVGESAILMEIFNGLKNPSHLYLDGIIEVYGPERDQIILDAIVEELWGR